MTTNLKHGLVTEGAKQHIAFYLYQQFNMLPFISAVEPLRIANRRAGERLYQWSAVTADGKAVIASNGMPLQPQFSIDNAPKFDMVFVCGPFDPTEINHPETLNWLKQQARHDILIGGLETGSFILAKAGLLEKVPSTAHWEILPQFENDFPELDISADVFETEGNRLTCAGGAAAIDAMLYLIEQEHGHELAASVADSMIYSDVRSPDQPQRMNLQARTGVNHPTLLECIELMEANIEEPLTPDELANLIGVSKRQIERLFQRYLQATPGRYYLALRLDAAHNLLQNSVIKVVEVALACGFKSSGHFSNCYQSRYGITPREVRKI